MLNPQDKIQRIGIAADHAGFELKKYLIKMLGQEKYEIIDFGNHEINPADDYPDYVIPLAKAISTGDVTRGIAVCGSGVGACITANKVAGVRACLIHEQFSAQQGVEDDDMNMICLGGRVVGHKEALKLSLIFLTAKFINIERHARRLAKVKELENIQKLKQ
jgi:ribose 5-phosphate isomerase B